MKITLRSCFALMILVVSGALFCLTSCMKKQCYSCRTDDAQVIADSVFVVNRVQQYCDMTVERMEALERDGNRDTSILIQGAPYTIKLTMTCTPQP